MRKPSKRELGILVGMVIATGLAHGDEGISEIVVQGYQYEPFQWVDTFANDFNTTPDAGSGPAGAYSANPTTHVNCTVNNLRAAENSNGSVGPGNPAPQPNNMALSIPLRYDNPIDIPNGSSLGKQYGAVNGSAGFMIFPSLANGIWAANVSEGNLAAAGKSITDLVNTWAPPGDNPNALSNTLSGLGISATLASETSLIDLTASQVEQVVAAFAWQEGYKPSGC
jgi:hypothetical protein